MSHNHTIQILPNSACKTTGVVEGVLGIQFVFNTIAGHRYTVMGHASQAAMLSFTFRHASYELRKAHEIPQKNGYFCCNFRQREENNNAHFMYLTAPPGTKYSLLITESNSWVPQELEGAFFHPLGGFRQITGRFGYHGSAWGNEDLKNYPFYAGPTTDPEKYQDFVHLGNDFKANPGDLVYAIGNGELIQTGDWSGPWGHYLIQTVTHQGQLYTALYGHLEADSILKKQSYKAGDVIAQVCHIPMKEEPDHLHFQLQKGDPINTNDPQGPARTVAGATHFSRWTKGNYMNVEDPRYFRFNK